MKNISRKDKELIKECFIQLEKNNNYDNSPYSNKASIVRAKSGKIYPGINLALWYGACAEVIAIGSAFANGERELDCIVSSGYDKKNKPVILASCGNCRQLMARHCPNIDIIIEIDGKYKKVKVEELLPYGYEPTSR